MYCVLAVAVNLNHCSLKLDELTDPSRHVLEVSVFVAVIVPGGKNDELNDILNVPVELCPYA
jgi:hypothetical protein